MNRNIRNTVLLCLLFIAVIVGAFVANTLREPLLSEEALREQGTILLPKPRELTLHGLVDQDGDTFDVEDLEGRWTFVFFGFTSCPDVCPVTMSVLAQVERALADSGARQLHDAFAAVLVTVDPERDDAAVLGQYVHSFSPNFRGVRGSPEDLADFARQVNAAFMKVPGQGSDYMIDHTANIVVINPRGHYHAFIRLPHEAEKIELAYKSLAGMF